MACRGVVTSRHDLASQVGLEVLARGGNASDADVATAFALPLLKRHECGVGGACPIMVFEPGRKATPDQPNPFVISGHGLHPAC